MSEADRWSRIGALFDAAIEQPIADREAWVRASKEPEDIQQEVLSLLTSHDDADGFLEKPPLGNGAALSAAETSSKAEGALSADPDPPPLAPGTTLGPYRIERVLGRGGMGIVYQAEDTRLHRRVALKLLSPSIAAEDRQRQRLKQEARAAAALSHPGIATVYALDEFDDQLLIASEYLDGETLRLEIDRGPLPLDRALATAIDIARALVAAHERGIVHRDLKPENIVRTTDGAIKVLDFGLAQFETSARDLVSATRLTQPGLVAGTPPYMAPEQLLGRSTDFRTDHFAFGIVLYELCSGRHPFGGQSLPSTIARILAGEPQPPERDEEIPLDVWQFIERCLQKEPTARFESTGELLASLETLAGGRRPTAYGPRQSSSTRGTSSTSDTSGTLATPFWWWQFHQLAAAVVYWAMVWPVWHVHRWIVPGGLFLFFATLAAVIVSANLRIHLWFSSRIYPHELEQQRAQVGTWIKWADVSFVALLVAGGLLLPDDREGWAALLIGVGVGSALSFLIIEPATSRAAFSRTGQTAGPSV